MEINELLELDAEKTYRFALLSCIMAIFLYLVFIIIDLIEGDTIELISEIMITSILIGSILLRNKLSNRMILYRVALYSIGLFFMVNVATGSGDETILYWVMILPLFTFSLLGKKEGLISSLMIFSLITSIVLFPFLVHGYHYDISNTIRFIGAYLFILFFTYQFKSNRESYFNRLIETTKHLKIEKDKLEKSVKEIKTLSGLLPMCASCKKIRDDHGYWNHVETYITNHSEAVLSHGICPECRKKLYPDFKNKK